MTPVRRRAAPLLLLAAAAACADAKAAEQELASPLFTAAPEGVRVATVRDAGPLSPAAGASTPGALRLALAPDGSDYLLAGPRDVDVDAAGRLWIVDAMQREVLAFDAGGALAGRSGGHGKGPGEYEAPEAVMHLPWNGQLAVWDATLQRLTVLTAEGKVVRTVSMGGAGAGPLPDLGQAGKRLRAWSGGFVLEVHSDPLRTPPAEQRGHLVRLDTLGQVVDTLLSFAVPAVVAEVRDNHTAWQAPPAFAPEAQWDVFPDGTVAFAPGGAYGLYLVPPDGGGAMHLVRAWVPERVTRTDRLRRLEQERDDGRVGRSDVTVAVIERLTRGRFARVRPSVTGVLADPAGRVWVRRFDTAADGAGRSAVWDVYSLAGDPLGTVRFEPRFLPRRADGRQVLGIRRDALGVASVAAFEVPSSFTRSTASR